MQQAAIHSKVIKWAASSQNTFRTVLTLDGRWCNLIEGKGNITPSSFKVKSLRFLLVNHQLLYS